MEGIVQLQNLTKKYEDTVALNQINVTFKEGTVYGLIGRNGAGKTTMLKIIAKQLFQTSGQLIVDDQLITCDEDVVLGRDFCMYLSNYRIRDIIAIASKLYPNWDKELETELIDQFELEIKKTYLKASKGMQTMVSLIIALCSNAKVLLLDEPYSGLDPINRETFYRILRNRYFNDEKTVIISSHIIKEIEGYFENAIIINKGQILVDEPLEHIREKSYVVEGNKSLFDLLQKHVHILGYDQIGNHYKTYIYDRISDRLKEDIMDNDGKISTMDLQDLIVQMCMTRREQDEL
jgi:ABC-2 type transport system ATP-binding protein